MARQIRSGRFGSPLPQQQPQTQEVTASDIANEPEQVSGRFGRSLKQTTQLRERVTALRSIRQQFMEEGARLEAEFFSKNISIQQSEEEYNKLDPRLQMFIKTTPTVRRQLAQRVLNNIEERIATTRANIQSLEQRRNSGQGGSNIEIDILEKNQLIQELNDLRDEASTGSFTFDQLNSYASSRAEARGQRARGRQDARERLSNVGITGRLAEQLLRGQKRTISEQEAEQLNPQARKFLGIQQKQSNQFSGLETTTRPKTVSELVADGIPRDIAIKINSGEGIGLYEFYRLPKNVRESTGLTRQDFEGEAQAIEVKKVRLFKNAPFFYGEKFQQFKQQLFPKAQPTRLSIELFGEDKAQKLAQDITTIGIAGATSIAGVPQFAKVIKVPTRAIRVPQFTEVQQPVILMGKETTLSQFMIKAELKAPSIVFDSRKAGGLLGVEKSLTKIPAKIQLTRTVVPVVNEGKVVTLTTKSGKLFELETLRGVSKRINIEEVTKLPKTQQFLAQRFVEKRVPISIKNLSKVVGKDKEFTIGYIEKTKMGKVTSPFKLKPSKLGKTTTRFETISKFKPFAETKDFEILKGRILFKDVTKPFARARGRTPSMKGIIKIMKEPIILDDFKGVNMLRPSRITSGRTPLSTTFARQELKQISKPLIKMPKLSMQSKSLNKATSTKMSGNNKLLFGSSSGVTLASRSLSSTDFARGFKSNNIPSSSAKTQQKTLSSTKSISLSKTTFNLKNESMQLNRQLPRFMQKDMSKQIPRQTVKLTQKQISKLTLKQINKSVSKSVPLKTTFRTPRNFKKVRFKFPDFKQKPIRTSKRKKRRDRSDLALVEGFTARILRFKPLRIKEMDIGKALARQGNPARIRLRPMIIPDFSMKRRKR